MACSGTATFFLFLVCLRTDLRLNVEDAMYVPGEVEHIRLCTNPH
jgi:hypothetical protein